MALMRFFTTSRPRQRNDNGGLAGQDALNLTRQRLKGRALLRLGFVVIVDSDNAALDMPEALFSNRLVDAYATQQRARRLAQRVRLPLIVEWLMVLSRIAVVQCSNDAFPRGVAFLFESGNKPL